MPEFRINIDDPGGTPSMFILVTSDDEPEPSAVVSRFHTCDSEQEFSQSLGAIGITLVGFERPKVNGAG